METALSWLQPEQEERLKRLLGSCEAANKSKVALLHKKMGRKVVGVFNDYVPEEVIFAAGMIPWRMTGSWTAEVGGAALYRPHGLDQCATHILASLLDGEIDFLDCAVLSGLDDDQRRLYDVWLHLGKTPLFTHYLYIPRKQSQFCIAEFRRGIARLVAKLEELTGSSISDESLRYAIEVYNKWRACLMELYELRKRDVPPLSGSEFLALTCASFVMPKDEFVKELEGLLDYLKERRSPLISKTRPRVLVSSEDLDLPDYLKVIEDRGCLVAMDDLNTGSRYIWQKVDTSLEPLHALAQRYLCRPGCPRMLDWDPYIDQVIRWVKCFAIDGVLNFPATWSYWREIMTPYFEKRLRDFGIRIMSFEREYYLADVGRLQTRVDGFIEVLTEEPVEGGGGA